MSPLEERLLSQLQDRNKKGTLRSIDSPENDDTKHLIDFSSNDYLGLARSRRQQQKVQASYDWFLKKYSQVPPLGATGSRLLSGNSSHYRQLETKLAKIHNRPSALIFNSGYDANLSILSSIPLEEDIILMDELAHNSLIMGVRMSRASRDNVMYFRHNNVEHLKQLLLQCRLKLEELRKGNIFIVCESVYSMDGDIAPLCEILDCAEKSYASVS